MKKRERFSSERTRKIVEETLKELPDPIRRALDESNIAIDLLDSAPEGFEDAFGTFSGGTFYDQEARFEGAPPEFARIELYLDSFSDLEGDGEEFDREVRLTVIHEIGHFLGFDEDALQDV